MHRLLICLALSIIPAFANYDSQIAVLLDVGARCITVHDSSGILSDFPLCSNPPSTRRVRFTLSPIAVGPKSGTTYSTCADPCTVNIYRDSGQLYHWDEYVDSSGNPLSTPLISQVQGAYASNVCGGLGTLPLAEQAIITTAPLPMPREVIAQDCYVDPTRIPLAPGHDSSGIRWWIRVHSPTYNALLPERIDGKMGIKVNSGSWINLTESTSGLVAVDEQKYYVRDNTGALKLFGGVAQVRDYTLAIPDGTIGSGDTTVDQRLRFNGTNGVDSGWRCLECFPIEGTDHSIATITFSGNTATATTDTAHGFATNDSVVIRNAPGMRMVSNGPRVITVTGATTFTFTACSAASGGSKTSSCSTTGVPSHPPINTNPNTSNVTEQPVMYATKMLVAATAFTFTDPTTFAAPGAGDATRGQKLFQTGNSSGTTGLHDQLVIPNTPYLDDTFHNAVCASCHSPTGADIKYFNSSNRAIEQRSGIHGLSWQDGLDITAYIRANAIAVPTAARPWNPPMQTCPGLSAGTYTKSGSTLTSIVVASNVGTATISSSPVGIIKANDPLTVWGSATTALNNTWTVSSVTSSTVVFTTSGVSNGTYTDAGLQITMANDVMAGCGVDTVLTYGYGEMLQTMGSSADWVWDHDAKPLEVALPYQAPDWNRMWLPTIYPADVYQSESYLTSLPYTRYQGYLSSVTPGSFSSYTTNQYLLAGSNTSLFYEAQLWAGIGEGNGRVNPFNWPGLPGAISPAQINKYRESVFQTSMVNTWTLMVEYKLLGLFGQYYAATYGASTKAGCPTTWGIPGNVLFIKGPHVQKMWGEANNSAASSILEGYLATNTFSSNLWYVMTPSLNPNSCRASAGNNIDNQYYDQFSKNVSALQRPAGYVSTIISPIFAPQAGRENTNFVYESGVGNTTGTDVTGILRQDMFSTLNAPAYYWFTASEWTTLVDNYLAMSLAAINAKSTATWQTISLNAGATNCDNGDKSAYGVWAIGSTNWCDYAASHLTWFTLFSSNATNVAAFKTWAAAVWPSHNFDVDSAAGDETNSNDYGTGDLSVAGAGKTITFSTSCPMSVDGTGNGGMPLWVGSGTGRPEQLLPGTTVTGGTCVLHSPGTLVVTTAYAHTGSWKATIGCSKQNLVPNYNQNYDATNTGWWRCRNMFP